MHKTICMILAGLALTATSCSRDRLPQEGNSPKLKIAATVFPIADMARWIGGDGAEVTQLSETGDSRGPAPTEAKLGEMKIVVVVGTGMDDWAVSAARLAGKKVLNLSQDEDFIGSYDAWQRLARMLSEGDANAATAPSVGRFEDPQVWLNLAFAQDFVLALIEAMANADPERSEYFRARGREYVKELQGIDEEFRITLAKSRGRYFVSDRPSFRYLAQAYGLKHKLLADVARKGSDAVREFVQVMHIRTVFTEGCAGVVTASPAASSSGATLVPLETCGSPDMPGMDSYLAVMRSNLQAIKAGIKEGN